MADMYSYNGVKLAKVPVMHEGCKYGVIFYDEEDACYYWFCSSEKFFLDGNQYMIPASATWGGNASREGAGYWSTAVFTPEESVETPDYYIVAHTGNITWSSVDICQKDTETVAYRTTKPLQYPTISFTGNSKLYYVNAESENLVCKATVNDGGTLSWAWYEGDAVVGTESSFTPPTDIIGEKTYFCVVTNDTEGQKLTTTSKTVTIRVREFFPLRECINWLLPGLCSRPLPLGAREPVAYLYKVEPVTEDVPIGNIAIGYTMVDPASDVFDPYRDVVKGTNLLDRFDFSSLRKESKGWNLFYNYYAPAEGYKEIRFTIGAYYSANYPNMDTIQLIFGHTANGETSNVTDTTLYFYEKDISPFALYIVAYWQLGRPVSYFLLALPYDKTMYTAGLCLGKPKTTVFPFAEVVT